MTDAALRQRIIQECLEVYLHDNADAWLLQPDGVYTRATPPSKARSRSAATHTAQAQLMARYGSSKE